MTSKSNRFFLCKIKLINILNALANSKAVFKAIHPAFNNQYIQIRLNDVKYITSTEKYEKN